jgi:hypothetical protein
MMMLVTMTAQQATQADDIVTPEAVDCPNQMLGYWKLDESTGPTYADYFGGNSATCEGLPCPTATDGKVKGEQSFSGPNGTMVNIPRRVVYDWSPSTTFSIELLDVRATLAVENDEKIVYVRCMIDETVLPVAIANTDTDCGVAGCQYSPA